MIQLFTNEQKKVCEGMEKEIEYCEYLGSVGCGTYGSCGFRDGKILEHLRQIWLDATQDRELGVIV